LPLCFIFRQHYPQVNDLQQMLELGETYMEVLLKKLRKKSSVQMQKYGKTLRNGSLGTFCEETWLTGRRKEMDFDKFPKDSGQHQPSSAVNDHNPKLFLANNFTLGIAPSGTMAGDVICRFWNTSITAVLRPRQPFVYDKKFEIIGRAHIARSPDWEAQVEKKSGGVMKMWMDIATLQVLTCGDDD